MSRPRPHAMVGTSMGESPVDTPVPAILPQHAILLWQIFTQRVEPLARITYRWALSDLSAKFTNPDRLSSICKTEKALVAAIYYMSASSLIEKECQDLFELPRIRVLAEYQARCEEALLRTNLFCMRDVTVIKAIIFYIMASYERLSTESLWSLMGITSRNAEKLGLHRDGSVLELSPLEVEDRRRVWWQLQHLELNLAIRIGLTPMTLTAGSDVKLSSNIEDDDISSDCTTMPKPRKAERG
ncbi:hypothetical protein EK21DRAFT_86229 [Setomelanomma holmii]|uniref:Xylanolytic transcriptional activator regulatory domain-containing protein n=1 Tax=Setomelanomma holmii TaxID=210430 RepID=A0A9P4LN46_9PLEO|nr:hypothetical protein EK21DRAFT_86229 [Setomelanomma holmii]